MRSLVSALLITVATGAVASDESSPLILQPEINSDGTSIAFSYQGDIWTVSSDGGRANRLTIHEGYERNPMWSPDGDNIAFSSDRFGNSDVFIMPKEGGRPSRLTYHSASDIVTGFTEDGQVLFNSRRLYAQVEREWEVLSVPSQGNGTEVRFMDALGFQAVVSPDGEKIAFVRGTCRISREDYRGPANRNIWIYHVDDDRYEQITDFDGNDFMPRWSSDNELYFISSRSGKYNVHKQRLGRKATQVTDEKQFGVEHFSISKSADELVYQAADKVVLMKDEGKNSTLLDINVASDFRFDPVTNKMVTNQLSEYSVSPDGKLSAYVLRGDIYVTRNDKEDKRSVRLTTGAARDRDVTWLNDKTLLFISDRNGQNDLFALTSADEDESNLFISMKHKVTELTSTKLSESNPIVSPNGEKLVYLQGNGKLLSAELSDGLVLQNQQVLLDGWASPNGVTFSPDSNWLAYSKTDLSFNEEVFIHPVDNSIEPVNVSMHPRYDSNPVWSPDGSKLGFVSMRNNGDDDIWFAWLKESDWEKSKAEWEREDKLDKPKKPEKPEKKDDDNSSEEGDAEDASDEEDATEKTAEIKMQIDLDGIYKRLEQVTRFAGNESELMFDKKGEHIYYAIGGSGRQNFEIDRNLYKIKWDGEDKKTVITGDQRPRALSLSDDGKHLYALTGFGDLVMVNTKSDKTERLAVRSQQSVEHLAERKQIFAEAWQALNQGFYDPKFHGNDWDALREKYEPLALKASTKEDFQYIFNLMLGQVNASHMGLYRGENQKQTQSTTTGRIGAEFMPIKDGLKVVSVLPGSPASKSESQLMEGDLLVSVNQRSVLETNVYEIFNNQVNQPVLLGIKRGGEDKELVIWPTDSLSNALYDDWVEERRRLTEEYSNGRLGYLHIRGMNWSSFERFERELMAAGYGKDGMLLMFATMVAVGRQII